MISFTILGEPASKANSRELVSFGRGDAKRPAIIKSKKARNYERDAAMQIPSHARVMFTGPVRVTLRIYYATERPDLDESVVLDVLQARFEKKTRKLLQLGVYVNDRQVREKHIYWGKSPSNPRTEVMVEPIVEQLTIELPVVRAPQLATADPF